MVFAFALNCREGAVHVSYVTEQFHLCASSDLLQKCHQSTIEAQLRQRRGHWIGHMLQMGNGRLALQLLYSRLPGRKRQGGQFQTLISLYSADVQSALDSQQRRHVAKVAAEKNAWNDLFAAKLD